MILVREYESNNSLGLLFASHDSSRSEGRQTSPVKIDAEPLALLQQAGITQQVRKR